MVFKQNKNFLCVVDCCLWSVLDFLYGFKVNVLIVFDLEICLFLLYFLKMKKGDEMEEEFIEFVELRLKCCLNFVFVVLLSRYFGNMFYGF